MLVYANPQDGCFKQAHVILSVEERIHGRVPTKLNKHCHEHHHHEIEQSIDDIADVFTMF